MTLVYVIEETVGRMKDDFNATLELEQTAANAGMMKLDILNDMKVIVTPCVRLVFAAYEDSDFDAGSAAGRRLLRGLLEVLPDSKIVEDCHGHIRLACKSQRNRRMTLHSMQDTLCNSPVLESRGIPHPCRVDRSSFLANFSRTKPGPRKKTLGLIILMMFS